MLIVMLCDGVGQGARQERGENEDGRIEEE
jgi:hypothetical protein